jgi:hypothetical protein
MADRRKKKQTIAKEFEITITPWEGMVFSQDPYTIPDNMAVWIEGLPKLTGAVESPPKSVSYFVPSFVTSDILHLRAFSLTNDYFCLSYYDETVGYCLAFYRGTDHVGHCASFGQTGKFDIALQGNTACWITGRAIAGHTFLRTFNGTNIYNLENYGIDGDAICYWKGRVFIGKDRTLIFSVPNPDYTGTTNPFNTANGAGYISINIGSFNKILALIPKEDSIYILTDNNIIALLGTTISNDPTQWYLTEIVSSFGITGVGRWVKYEHTIYYHSPFGIISLVATAPEKIDDAITPVTAISDSIRDISYFVYEGIPYIAVVAKRYGITNSTDNVIYCYNLLTKRWYVIPENCVTMTTLGNTSYVAVGNEVKKMFQSSNYMKIKVLSKIFFNDANIYYNLRRVYLYGRGNSEIDLSIIGDYGSSYVSSKSEYRQPIFVFQTPSGNFIFNDNYSNYLTFGQIALSFFLNAYYFSNGYSNRYKQFQLQLEQDSSNYSELISIKIKGTLGARYV